MSLCLYSYVEKNIPQRLAIEYVSSSNHLFFSGGASLTLIFSSLVLASFPGSNSSPLLISALAQEVRICSPLPITRLLSSFDALETRLCSMAASLEVNGGRSPWHHILILNICSWIHNSFTIFFVYYTVIMIVLKISKIYFSTKILDYIFYYDYF